MYDGLKLLKKTGKTRSDIFIFTVKQDLHFERLSWALIVIIHLETVPANNQEVFFYQNKFTIHFSFCFLGMMLLLSL